MSGFFDKDDIVEVPSKNSQRKSRFCAINDLILDKRKQNGDAMESLGGKFKA